MRSVRKRVKLFNIRRFFIKMNKISGKSIDWSITVLPFCAVLLLCLNFLLFPVSSAEILNAIRSFLSEEFGWYYLLLGTGIFFVTLYMAFSRFGKIRLGGSAPKYSLLQWGAMMFTAGLAADILFYSLFEWMIYANEKHVREMGDLFQWSGAYSLFHWGPIPWGFYIALSVAFSFMIHVRKRKKQKYSEACRALLGKKTDGWSGKCIDLLAVFALIAGTATTFSVSAPLLSEAIASVFHIHVSTALTISVLLVICLLYTLCAYFGISGVSRMASSCSLLFLILLLYVLFFGGMPRYILESGLTEVGALIDRFFFMSLYTDPLRTTGFPQNWTVFYWAYWMVWCVATPFFIGSISYGRTVRQVVLGGYLCGLSGTWISFVVLGNYGMGIHAKHKMDLLMLYAQNGNPYETVIRLLETLPSPRLVLILLSLTMIAFYATSFDSIALVASAYSYKELSDSEEPGKKMKVFWSVLLILLPIGLLFSERSMSNLQTVSIIAAFPIGAVMLLILISFFKDASKYLSEREPQ